MEIRRLLSLAAAATLVAACSTDDTQTPTAPAGGVTISCQLPATRVALAEGATPQAGLTAMWQQTDRLAVFCDGTPTTLAASNVSGHRADFTGALTPAPAQGATLHAIVMPEGEDYTAGAIDHSQQTGLIADLGRYDLLTGTATYTGPDITMNIAHRVAILRATIDLPAATDATEAMVTLYGTGVSASATYDGATGTLTPADGMVTIDQATVSGRQVTFYAALMAGTLTDIRADVVVGDDVYADLLVAPEATLQAGQLYTVGRTLQQPEDLTVWTTDAAWSHTYDISNYRLATVERAPAEESDWLTVTSDGNSVTVSATANTTGAPRQASITFGNGAGQTTVDVTQIEQTDFAGDWMMTCFKKFTSTGSATCGTTDATWASASTTPPNPTYDMTVYDGLDYQNEQELSIEYRAGTTVPNAYQGLGQALLSGRQANMRMEGLYENLTTELLGQVDHAARKATVDMLINSQSTATQQLATGCYAGQWAALMPEFYKSTAQTITSWGSNSTNYWDFHFATLGGYNYFWYTGQVSVAGHTTTVAWRANNTDHQLLKTSTAVPALTVAGLQVMRYTEDSMNASHMIRQKTQHKYSKQYDAAWAVTYQGDVVMRRTASGYKEITVAGK